MGEQLLIGSIVIHRGEEPPLVMGAGSGAIFFAGCPLKCSYCQNSQVSHLAQGQIISSTDLAVYMTVLQEKGCTNINLVTPTHYTPQILPALDMAHDLGLTLPVMINSGGYERVETLRAWNTYADIYLMDEPISHLDADMRRRMRGELKRLHQTREMTVVYVTHDQLEAMSMADRIAVMNEGIIRQLAPPTEIFHHPQDEFVAGFIGSPPMNFLDCDLRSKDGSYAIALEGFTYPIPPQIGQKIEESGNLSDRKVRLGVRPEDVSLSVQKKEAALVGNVLVTEPVGESVIYRVRIGEKLDILVEIPTEGAVRSEGETVEVRFDPERLHFFHPETGKALYT